jgi:hypothetical protein
LKATMPTRLEKIRNATATYIVTRSN